MAVAKTHLSLNVTDVDRSTAWYEAFFGMSAHKRRPGYANFDVSEPPLKLALNENVVAQGGPLNHLGILVPSTAEVDAARKRLEDAGLVTFSEENVTCCYALQDKIWVRDPDGNAWEVYALLDDLDDDDHDHEDAGRNMSVPAGVCCAPGSGGCCG